MDKDHGWIKRCAYLAHLEKLSSRVDQQFILMMTSLRLMETFILVVTVDNNILRIFIQGNSCRFDCTSLIQVALMTAIEISK